MTASIELRDEPILITGGLGAIAEFVVRTLCDAGATMVVTDRLSPAEARPILIERGQDHDRCLYRQMDVTDPDEVARVANDVFEQFPKLRIACGHAGGTGIERFRDSTAESFDRIVRFNLLGQTYFARAVLDQWLRRETHGHMIFTSSYVSRLPHQAISAYVASKAGLDMFAKTLALEYAGEGIRFNMISPGNVAAGSSLAAYESDPEYRAAVDRMSPLGRRNSPEAIANVFLFLCSPLADELDGHILNVDAGVGLPKID